MSEIVNHTIRIRLNFITKIVFFHLAGNFHRSGKFFFINLSFMLHVFKICNKGGCETKLVAWDSYPLFFIFSRPLSYSDPFETHVRSGLEKLKKGFDATVFIQISTKHQLFQLLILKHDVDIIPARQGFHYLLQSFIFKREQILPPRHVVLNLYFTNVLLHFLPPYNSTVRQEQALPPRSVRLKKRWLPRPR